MSQHITHPMPRPKLGHVETIVVDSTKVACDGGLGPLGHPRVWLKIAGHQAVCPYCSRLFVLNPESAQNNDH